MSTVGQALGGVFGAVAGFFIGGPSGALYGAQIGMTVGGIIDPPKGPDVQGPRLDDLTVQTATYGAVIPRVYGTVALYGNVFWLENNALKEVAKKTKSGGKGGGSKTTTTTYSYYATFAVGLCDCTSLPIVGVRRIWIKDILFYDAGTTDQAAMRVSNANSSLFTLHPGSESQLPDARMQATLGVAATPAYRGLAYLVFNDLPLAAYANSLMGAQVKVEVVCNGAIADYAVIDNRLIPPPALGQNIWSGLAWNGRMFVAARNSGNNNLTAGMIATSPDGKTWTLRDIPYSPNVYGGGSVACSPDLWLVTHYYWPNYVWASRDGITWVPRYCPGNPGFVNLFFNGTWWMAMPREYNGQCSISKDGVTWQLPASQITPYGSFNDQSLSGNDTVFLAVKGTTAFVFNIYSASWKTVTITGRATGTYIVGYWKVKGCFIALGNTEASFSYDNGDTWATYTVSGIGGNPSFFVDCGNFVSVAWNYSFDGITWIYRSLPNYQALSIYGGAWNGAILLWVGSDSYDINDCFSIAPHTLTQGIPTLGAVVQSEVLQSKLLGAGDIDVSLMTQQIRGVKIAAVAAIRSGVSTLQGAWPFDVVQHGYKLQFKPRGSASVATITAVELDAQSAGDAPGVALTNAREMDTVLPRRVRLTYLDTDREYDTNEQYAERLNTDAVNVETIELAIVLTASEAAAAVERLLYLYWMERYEVAFTLPSSYNKLEPADVITLVTPVANYSLRLTSINYTADGRLECQAKYNASATYISNAVGASGSATAQTLQETGRTTYELLDIPLLIDAQDTPGFSAAVSSYFPNWSGSILFRSEDAGQTWTELQGYLPPGSVIGYGNAIGAGRTDLCDKASVLMVSMVQGTLSSVTEAALLNGANLFAYGARGRWEIIGAQNCVLQADGTYWLTDLLRGRFGTEWACALHGGGDTVVSLDTAHLTFLVMSLNSIGLSRSYRAVTLGDSFDSVSDDLFTYTGVNLECLAPVYFNGSKDPATNDWNINWIRRTRKGGEWRDLVDATLSEASESYDLDIFADGLYSAIKRSVTVSVPNFTYTNAMQVADFGSSQNFIVVNIYQKSDKVGRGYPLKAWLPRTPAPPWPSFAWLSMNDAALTDYYGHTVTKTGSVARSAVRSKWGGYASYHANASASADYLSITGVPALGQQVFCFECWANFTDLSPGSSYLFGYSQDNSGWGFSVFASGGSICFKASNYLWINVAAGFVIDQWFHVRLVFTGGATGCFYLYVNGNYVGGICNIGWNGSQSAQSIPIGFYNFRGYIDDFRVTLGNTRGGEPQPPNAEFME